MSDLHCLRKPRRFAVRRRWPPSAPAGFPMLLVEVLLWCRCEWVRAAFPRTACLPLGVRLPRSLMLARPLGAVLVF